MESVIQPCPVCDKGTAYPQSHFHLIESSLGNGAVVCRTVLCDYCECHSAGSAELQENKATAIKLRKDLESYAETGKLPDDMLNCWSCKAFIYENDRRDNDGHCPACHCEIEI